MRIVFMGTPEFAVASLDILVKNNFNIVGVITVPDKPAGRGQQLHQSAVKQYAVENNLPILQPEKLKDPEFINALKNLNADLQIVVAFRMLPEVVWNMPKYGTINLHGSLLPQYRGAAPINRAVMNGEKETGVSTFFLQHEIDTGKIIFQDNVSIGENETAGEVHDKLMHIGARLILKTVKAIELGNYPQTEQGALISAGTEIKTAPKIFKEDCKIDWTKSVQSIHNFIRGLSPYPTAFTEFINPEGNSISVKIFNSTTEECAHALSIPSIVSDSKNLKVAVKGGFLHIINLQMAGKKRMTTQELLRGTPINADWKIKI